MVTLWFFNIADIALKMDKHCPFSSMIHDYLNSMVHDDLTIYIYIDWTWWFSSSLREKKSMRSCLGLSIMMNPWLTCLQIMFLGKHMETWWFSIWFSRSMWTNPHGFPWKKNTYGAKGANVQGDFAGEGQSPWNHWWSSHLGRDKYQRTWYVQYISYMYAF